MLPRQDLRRRHNRDLVSGVYSLKRGNGSDDCLSRTHVAVQKPVHRVVFFQIL